MFDQSIHSVREVFALFGKALKGAWRDVVDGSTWKLLSFIALTIAFGYYFGGDAWILWPIFFAFALYAWDNRILGAFAILLLVSCPILISLQQELWAEAMAIYAYYFLVMTVALQIIEFKRNPPAPTEKVKPSGESIAHSPKRPQAPEHILALSHPPRRLTVTRNHKSDQSKSED